MDITMLGLQNAGKTSLLRVLAVSADLCITLVRLLAQSLTLRAQGGEFTTE
jgi:hypothetical protein